MLIVAMENTYNSKDATLHTGFLGFMSGQSEQKGEIGWAGGRRS